MCQRARQRRVAGTVEIGVGLVKDHHPGIAEEGASKGYTLLLTAGQWRAIGGNVRLVALRQGGDHFVDIGKHGGLIDVGVSRIFAHTSDVGLD